MSHTIILRDYPEYRTRTLVTDSQITAEIFQHGERIYKRASPGEYHQYIIPIITESIRKYTFRDPPACVYHAGDFFYYTGRETTNDDGYTQYEYKYRNGTQMILVDSEGRTEVL